MEQFPFTDFRQQFPILNRKVNGKTLVYFDNAATSQKPSCVIDCHNHYYQVNNANVHRASHALSAKATVAYEQARQEVKTFINAKNDIEIIWTKGSTESINLVAQSWGRMSLQPNDEIVLSHSEHHANIVPWQIVAQQTGAKIKILPLTSAGQIDVEQAKQIIGARTRIVCFGHISNVIGRINPIAEIISIAKKHQALTLVDGAQAIAHLKVDVSALDCDFYVFSAHKVYGPTGVGVLYGKQALLEKMPPYQAGGEMIKSVSFAGTSFNGLPHKFEAGTPNIAGIVAFGAAINFINHYGHVALFNYETQLRQYCYTQLSGIKGLKFIVNEAPDIPVFSFTLAGHHNHDVAAALDSVGIAVRSGHHCAMPLMQYLNIEGCIRLSLAAYNSVEEIDFAVHELKALTQQTPELKSTATQSTTLVAPKNADNVYLTANDILAIFSRSKSWDSKHREIMMLGKQQVRLPAEDKTEMSLISGCESHAWLVYRKEGDGIFRFKADSDAKVIRGLLAIILAVIDNKTAAQIIAFDMNGYFAELGLMQHLSPSRGNGLKAIVQKIYQVIS